jgi:hypothetical protein
MNIVTVPGEPAKSGLVKVGRVLPGVVPVRKGNVPDKLFRERSRGGSRGRKGKEKEAGVKVIIGRIREQGEKNVVEKVKVIQRGNGGHGNIEKIRNDRKAFH